MAARRSLLWSLVLVMLTLDVMPVMAWVKLEREVCVVEASCTDASKQDAAIHGLHNVK